MRRFFSVIVCLLAAGTFVGHSRAQQQPATPSQTGSATSSQQEPALKARPELQTQKDKFSYALGMNLGTNLHRQSVPVDPDLLMRGLKDSLAGGSTLMTEAEARAALTESRIRAIASRNAGEGDVLDERLERNCHTRNIALAVGGK